MEKRDTWSSRGTFIMAAIGSAVGLGNAWRFPGLAAKYGGGAFLIVYVVAMLVLGVPLLAMEISIGRHTKSGAPMAMRAVNKKCEFIGWAATSNAFAITTYYAVVFAWVLLMIIESFKFIGLTGTADAADKASNLFFNSTGITGKATGSFNLPITTLIALVIAWVAIYACVRKGTRSAGKVVKYTGLILPVSFLVIMAIKGMTLPNAGQGLAKLFTPDFSTVIAQGKMASLVIDAMGQVFFSLSIMMAIMFAYGSYVKDDANIAADSVIIAFSDLFVSVLSGVVMFTTLYGVGLQDKFTDSGIATAFIVYPQAIVSLTNNGVVNAIFGAIFYLCLASLAIDSAFSIVEGVSAAVSDKFQIEHHKTTLGVCIVAGIISLVYATSVGLGWLDIVDHFTNQFGMILVGVLECFAVGWLFDANKVLKEANLNTKRFKLPKWWFDLSIKFISPIVLLFFCCWNLYTMFAGKDQGVYGGYPLWTNIVGGWLILVLSFASGFIINGILKAKGRKDLLNHNNAWKD